MGFLFGFAGVSYLDGSRQRSEVLGYVYVGLFLVAFLLMLWVKEDLKKWRYEYESKLLGKSKLED